MSNDDMPDDAERPPLVVVAHNGSPIVVDMDEMDKVRTGSSGKVLNRITREGGP